MVEGGAKLVDKQSKRVFKPHFARRTNKMITLGGEDGLPWVDKSGREA